MTELLRVESVTVRFAGLVALSDVSFAMPSGFVQAVIGPNGAGKSTLFGVVSGHLRPTFGRVFLDGADLSGHTPAAVARAGLRRTFQNGSCFGELSVLENVMTGAPGGWRLHPLANALRLPGARLREAAALRSAKDALDRLGIADLADRMAGQLPAGQQRLVEIARALAGGARLLLLDEPAVGLTLGELDVLSKVLTALAAQGVAVLLVEHVIDFVMAIADRIIVLNYGEIIATGEPAAIRANEAVLEAYLGHA